MRFRRRNLVLLVWYDEPKIRADFMRIAARIPWFDRDVRCFVVEHHKRDQLRLLPLWLQPTLSVSPGVIANRKLLPGRLVTGQLLYKHGEYARLEAAGIPVPQWTVMRPDTRLDPLVWGPYVVEKPSAGRIGAYVRIRKTGRVQYTPPEAYPPEHHGRKGPMIVQRFIYTGRWPTSYRVVTLFGEVLYCYRQTSHHGYPLASRWDFCATGGINIVSNTKDMAVEMVKDEEVIAFAEKAHWAAFPEIPLLQSDIVRDFETGELFVLECHAHGGWPFASEICLRIQATHNIDFAGQFGAFDKAACILARQTHRLADITWPRSFFLQKDGGAGNPAPERAQRTRWQ